MSAAENIYVERMQASLARRHKKARRFALYGKLALGFAAAMLVFLLYTIVTPGIAGFTRYELTLEVEAPEEALSGVYSEQMQASYIALSNALIETVPEIPMNDVTMRRLISMVGPFAVHDVKRALAAHTGDAHVVSIRVPLADKADQAMKGYIDLNADASLRPITDDEVTWLKAWKHEGLISRHFNTDFFTQGDSRSPEGAGFLASVVGSLFTLFVCMAFAFPVSVMAAVYLEEFARKNRFTDALEVAINNLAAVPSIIYGLLGLSVFLSLFGMPRSSSLVGGLTLSLLVLPVMIIATRAALRAVPPSMREAAYGLGSTPLQVVWYHVLPYAMPGMMTGAILSMCRAIGETAPLLMIGMVAFVADVPTSVLDAATAMPVQVYVWASSPEMGFTQKTSAGIIVLLVMLFALNALAITLRKRFERSW